jgi:hypothetical protein
VILLHIGILLGRHPGQADGGLSTEGTGTSVYLDGRNGGRVLPHSTSDCSVRTPQLLLLLSVVVLYSCL